MRRLGAALFENDHRADGVLALDVRDVVALDPYGQRRQLQPRLEVVQQRGGPLRVVIELDPHLSHRLGGIRGRLLEQLALLAALRDPDRDGAAAALGQPLLDQLAVGQHLGNEDFLGDVRRIRVVLTDEGVEDVGPRLVLIEADEVEVLRAREPALADTEDAHRALAIRARQAEEVLVVAAHRQHFLPFRHSFHGIQAVAVAGGGLVFQLVGGFLHLLLEPLRHMVRAAIEEAGDLVELLVVVLAVDEPRAGRRAEVQVIVKAWTPQGELGVLATAVWDHTPDGLERRAQRDRVRVRPPVPSAVTGRPADQRDAREIFVQGQLDVEIVLVVAQPDVEAGAMPLDHRLLEDERFFLGRRGDHLELVDPRDHGGDVLRQHARGLEVIRHAVAQIQRLAGVDHPSLDVAHQVDTRGVGQRLQTLF